MFFENKNKQLFKAIDKCDSYKAGELLSKLANVNARDILRDNCTPLHVAASTGWIESAKILLDWHANINAVSNHNYTALMSAVIKGHFRMIELLINSGADLNIKTMHGLTAYDFAKMNSDKDPDTYKHILSLFE